MIFLVVFFITFFCVLIIFAIVNWSKKSNKNNRHAEINKHAFEMLEEKKFNINKTFYINDNFSVNEENCCKKIIVVDNENKKMCFVDYEQESSVIVDFEEILNYEIYENGNSSTTGSSFGGVFGRLYEAQTDQKCQDLRLIIRLKKLDCSQVVYDIISDTLFNVGIVKSSNVYRSCIKSLQDAVSFLEVIKNQNSKEK